MEYTIGAFTQALFDLMLESNQFPYMRDEELDRAKHSKRNPLHLRDAIKNTTVISGDDNTQTFDIGNEILETTHPYYHILEDAPIIRKSHRGTKKTKGTQEMIKEISKRDYGYVYWNGKTFTKEYSKNVRGSRNRTTKVSHWTEDYAGNNVFVNRDANSYQNIHYKYIENILNTSVVNQLAMQFGLKVKRTVDTGLAEEFAMQEGVSVEDVLAAFDSFN